MNPEPQEDVRDISVAQVKDQLKALARVKPPPALKDRLLAAVPHRAAGQVGDTPAPRWPQAARYVAAAAALILVASVLLRFVTPTARRYSPVADINDRAASATLADHNSLGPPDINVSDSNAIP